MLTFMMADEHGTILPQYAIPQTITVSFLSGSSTPSQSFTENAPVGDNYWRVWSTKSMLFYATDTSVTLDFGSITAYDVGLDNVIISDAQKVPEPSTLLLLCTGLAGVVALGRKFTV